MTTLTNKNVLKNLLNNNKRFRIIKYLNEDLTYYNLINKYET